MRGVLTWRLIEEGGIDLAIFRYGLKCSRRPLAEGVVGADGRSHCRVGREGRRYLSVGEERRINNRTVLTFEEDLVFQGCRIEGSDIRYIALHYRQLIRSTVGGCPLLPSCPVV